MPQPAMPTEISSLKSTKVILGLHSRVSGIVFKYNSDASQSIWIRIFKILWQKLECYHHVSKAEEGANVAASDAGAGGLPRNSRPNQAKDISIFRGQARGGKM